MPAYKYSARSVYNPFIQASVKAKMGKNYTYNGRFYTQIKENNLISYADILYSLNVRLVSWTSNTTDIELEIKETEEKEIHNSVSKKCDSFVNSALKLVGKTIYIKVSDTGSILKVYNTTDLADVWSSDTPTEESLIQHLEANPIVSALLSGYVEETAQQKNFVSNIFPNFKIKSDIVVKSKKERMNKALNTDVLSKPIQLSIDEQKQLQVIYGVNSSLHDNYKFYSVGSYSKGIGNVLPYSLRYSIEERIGDSETIFFSVGMEKVILEKDVNYIRKIYSSVLRRISSFLN